MKNVAIIIMTLLLLACSGPEARKPIVRKTGSYMNETIERNRVLNKMENSLLDRKMKQDSGRTYHNSSQGFWYAYAVKNDSTSYLPASGDEVLFRHEIRALNDDVYYSFDEMGIQSYLVDKQELISGLQDGIKLMKKGERVDFLFPSHKAYGYTGNDKVSPNEPLQYTVEILEINKLSK